MKKPICLLIFAILILHSSISTAKSSYNYSSVNDVIAISKLVRFASAPAISNLNGLEITPLSPTGGFEKRLTPIDKNKYYTDGYTYVGVDGINIFFNNETDEVAIIHWRESIVSVNGKSYGMPYIAGMPYRDSGNPAATPNTIIPPRQTATITVYLPTISFFDGDWYHYPALIPIGGSVKFSCYINTTVNKKTSYISIETPPIFIDIQTDHKT